MRKFLRALLAMLAVVVLVVGGAAAGDYPVPYTSAGPGLAPARGGVNVIAAALSPRSLAGSDPSRAARSGGELVKAARLGGVSLDEAFATAFPSSAAVLAMLALDRDIDDFIETAAFRGRAGAFYRREIALTRELRPLRGRYEAAYGAAQAELERGSDRPAVSMASGARGGGGGSSRKPLYDPARFERPLPSDISWAHPFALDVFFAEMTEGATGQEGPPIPSISSGIVIASANDWRGGAGAGAWLGGGLSPASGNGVVIYDRGTRRYYSYFHMKNVVLRRGELVERGQILGRGGNTGMNARRPDHGGHVHIEIFDARAERAVDAMEILELTGL